MAQKDHHVRRLNISHGKKSREAHEENDDGYLDLYTNATSASTPTGYQAYRFEFGHLQFNTNFFQEGKGYGRMKKAQISVRLVGIKLATPCL